MGRGDGPGTMQRLVRQPGREASGGAERGYESGSRACRPWRPGLLPDGCMVMGPHQVEEVGAQLEASRSSGERKTAATTRLEVAMLDGGWSMRGEAAYGA